MKDKLTLSVDGDVVRRAKAQAREEGTSLSSVVEESLKIYAGPAADDAAFLRKWAGKFPLPARDPNDPKLEYLLDKYARPRE